MDLYQLTRMKQKSKVQGNVYALAQIFNAMPLPFFSAAMNCAPKHRYLPLQPFFQCLLPSLILSSSRAQYNIAV